MSVFKRKTSGGESKFYHHKFMADGKWFYGVCKGCTTQKAAMKYEKKIRNKTIELGKQKTVKALIENFRYDLTGGSKISLKDAYDLSLDKPRKRQPSATLIKSKRAYWNDFIAFMESKHPDISDLTSVRQQHAEAYIAHLRSKGRFDKQITFKAKSKTAEYQAKSNLSPKTCNMYQMTLSEVFSRLFHDAGLIANPFDEIEKPDKQSETREAFTEAELHLIADNADDFIKPIFIIGITTAFREGDICTLKWSEIDDANQIVRRRMRKTGKIVEIPIMPPLAEFLRQQRIKTGKEEYILPEHATMYLNNPSGISYRVKAFLEGLGIKTTKKVDGRDRAISVKDVHSLRHSFCYYAGLAGIPLMIVQNVVGHMSPEMTKMYQAHASRETTRLKLLQLPDLMGLAGNTAKLLLGSELEKAKSRLNNLIGNCTDIEKLNQAAAIFDK